METKINGINFEFMYNFYRIELGKILRSFNKDFEKYIFKQAFG